MYKGEDLNKNSRYHGITYRQEEKNCAQRIRRVRSSGSDFFKKIEAKQKSSETNRSEKFQITSTIKKSKNLF
jgi:hypothetical protein